MAAGRRFQLGGVVVFLLGSLMGPCSCQMQGVEVTANGWQTSITRSGDLPAPPPGNPQPPGANTTAALSPAPTSQYAAWGSLAALIQSFIPPKGAEDTNATLGTAPPSSTGPMQPASLGPLTPGPPDLAPLAQAPLPPDQAPLIAAQPPPPFERSAPAYTPDQGPPGAATPPLSSDEPASVSNPDQGTPVAATAPLSPEPPAPLNVTPPAGPPVDASALSSSNLTAIVPVGNGFSPYVQQITPGTNYTAPDSVELVSASTGGGSSTNVGAIVGGIVGALALIGKAPAAVEHQLVSYDRSRK